MSKIALTAIAVIICGCTFTDTQEFCLVPPDKKAETIEKVSAFIKTVSGENVTYQISPLLLEEGKLSKGTAGCWTYLLPQPARPGLGVLDGDGGLYVNLETMEVGPVFWFRY